jgi:O-methyltransferase
MQIATLANISRIIQQFVRSLDDGATSPCLLKIGAHDGLTGDPLGESIRSSRSWGAHLVEPVPEIHARLNENYSDKQRFHCHLLAIGSGSSEAAFYSVHPRARKSLPGLPGWANQLGSFVPGHIEKCLGDRVKPFVQERTIKKTTLAEFMAQHRIPDPTLLHIDVEGLDWEVLQTYNFEVGCPRAILIEHKHLTSGDKSALLELLAAREYFLVVESPSDFAAFHNAEDACLACLGSTAYRRRESQFVAPLLSNNQLREVQLTMNSGTKSGTLENPPPLKIDAGRARRRSPLRSESLGHMPDVSKDFVDYYGQCKSYSMASPERMFALFEATQYVIKRKVVGAFVECGVWRGGSIMMVAYTLAGMGVTDRDLYLFDTFEGTPKPDESKDIDLRGRKAVDDWLKHDGSEHGSAWANARIEEVRDNIAKTGYPTDRIHLIKGMVEQTVPHKRLGNIALLRLDTDWYSSTRHELEHLFPLLRVGGVLIVDDYGHFQGARQATDEYFASKEPELLCRVDYTGRLMVKTNP